MEGGGTASSMITFLVYYTFICNTGRVYRRQCAMDMPTVYSHQRRRSLKVQCLWQTPMHQRCRWVDGRWKGRRTARWTQVLYISAMGTFGFWFCFGRSCRCLFVHVYITLCVLACVCTHVCLFVCLHVWYHHVLASFSHVVWDARGTGNVIKCVCFCWR